MRRPPRHRLDALPLLDVFMVVLFVFASIEEERAAESIAEAEVATSQTQRARAALEDALEAARTEREALAQERAAVAAMVPPGTRELELLERLLDHSAVFELEIAGELGGDGTVRNHCCYRKDAARDGWRSCPDIPSTPQGLSRWWQDDAALLRGALRRTHGGRALTIVRQDGVATYDIAARVRSVLAQAHPDHELYTSTQPGATPKPCGVSPP